MTLISGLRTALMTPKIAATATSVPIFDQSLPASSSMPGTTAVATARAAAETTTRSKNLMRPDITRLGDRFARLPARFSPGPGSFPGPGGRAFGAREAQAPRIGAGGTRTPPGAQTDRGSWPTDPARAGCINSADTRLARRLIVEAAARL